jgi:hypothetical protein
MSTEKPMQETTTFKHITTAAVSFRMFFIKSGNITSKEKFIYARQVKEKRTLTYVHDGRH